MKKVENISTFTYDKKTLPNKNSEWVEVADIKEMISAVFVFFLIMFSILFFGLKGNQDYTIYNSVHHLFKNKKPFRNYYTYDFDLLSFNSKNRFLKFYLYFYRNTTRRKDSNVSFQYMTKFVYPNITELSLWHNIDLNLHLENGQQWSEEYPLYQDHMLDFSSISFQLRIAQDNNSIFKGFEFGTLYCSTESTQFNIYFNSLMTFLLIFALIQLSYKKWSKQIDRFQLDQIFLFPLIALMVFSNNPLYFYHLKHPTRLYYYWSMFFVPICDSFIYFSIVFMMFYSISPEGKKRNEITKIKTTRKKIIKMSIITFIFSFTYAFVMIAFNYNLTKKSILINFPTLVTYKNNIQLEKYKSVANAVSAAIVIILLLASFIINEDITYASIIYVLIFMPIFIQEFCFNGIFIYFKLTNRRNNAEVVMSKMIIQNLFCIFLVYIHWPFDIREKYEQFNDNVDDENETFADTIDT